MFKAIVRFSIRKKLFVGLTTLFLFIGGIYAMLTLPIDAVPDITNNQVQIVTVSPTLAPQEVEQLITMPIEIAMSNIMNVEDIRSVSRFGLSVVTVVFKEDVPTLDARQLINEQIQICICSLISWRASSVGTSSLKTTVTTDSPKRLTERISSTFMMLLIAISMGMVMSCSTSCGASVGDTVTICT